MQQSNDIKTMYHKCFNTDAGKRVLEDLERTIVFTPNTEDVNDVFMKLGKIELLKYIKKMKEAK